LDASVTADVASVELAANVREVFIDKDRISRTVINFELARIFFPAFDF
jgi:hypothetical protein